MRSLLGILAIGLGGAGFVYACVIYALNLRIPNIDLMGLAIGFDRIWFTAAAATGAGLVLAFSLSWGWIGLVMVVAFVVRLPLKHWLHKTFRPGA